MRHREKSRPAKLILLFFFVSLQISPAAPLPKAWLGIAFEDAAPGTVPRDYLPITESGPVKVVQVFKGASASQAGLQPGDYILGINGMLLQGRKTLLDTVQSKGVGDIVTLKLGREGRISLQKLALSPKPEDMRSLTRMLIGSPAPELRGAFYHAESSALSKLRGKVVVLDFWATWCGPCRMTIPSLQALYQKYRNQGLVLIGISSEDSGTLKAFQIKASQNYPLFHDPGQLTQREYAAFAYPTLVLIDRKGIVQRVEVGAHSAADMERWIRELL